MALKRWAKGLIAVAALCAVGGAGALAVIPCTAYPFTAGCGPLTAAVLNSSFATVTAAAAAAASTASTAATSAATANTAAAAAASTADAALASATTANTDLIPHVATNTALKAKATTSYATIIRDGFTTAGDGGAATYTPSNLACTLNSGDGDDGSEVKSSDGKCWLVVPPPSGVDVRVWGAKDDAEPGAVGAACAGITGTDNIAAFNTAYTYALNNRVKLVGGGAGIYRLNSKWVMDGFTSPQPWNSNSQRHPEIDISAPIVTCGTDAGISLTGGALMGKHVHIHSLTGPGAGSTIPVAGGGAENIGIQIESTDNEYVKIDFISDYTYDIVLGNSFSNTIELGTGLAALKVIYLRGTTFGVDSTQNNLIKFNHIGGAYTFNGDTLFAARQARSCWMGVDMSGAGQGNTLSGGTIEYCVKSGPAGEGGVQLNVGASDDYNFFDVWIEGWTGALGKSIVIAGNNNTFFLSNMATASSDILINATVTGTRNHLFGPNLLNTTYGASAYAGGNFINDDPTPFTYTPTIGCNAGSGTFSSPTVTYREVGKFIYWHGSFGVTNIGSCTGYIFLTTPSLISSERSIFMGQNTTTGEMLQCAAQPSTQSVVIKGPANSMPATTAGTVECTGWLRVN